MKLSDIGEVKDFLTVVNRCEGDVWLQSKEGNKINLKSSLSQYVAVAELIRDEGNNLELYCSKPSAEAKFVVLFSEHADIP